MELRESEKKLFNYLGSRLRTPRVIGEIDYAVRRLTALRKNLIAQQKKQTDDKNDSR